MKARDVHMLGPLLDIPFGANGSKMIRLVSPRKALKKGSKGGLLWGCQSIHEIFTTKQCNFGRASSIQFIRSAPMVFNKLFALFLCGRQGESCARCRNRSQQWWKTFSSSLALEGNFNNLILPPRGRGKNACNKFKLCLLGFLFRY